MASKGQKYKPRTRTPIEVRFWRKVDKSGGPDACWPWLGRPGGHGYGELGLGSREEGNITVHRLSLQLAGVVIPTGMFVCHKCDVKLCVNPTHLYVGTLQDNARDAFARGQVPRGERHGGAKINVEIVREVRFLLQQGHTQTRIADELGLTRSHVGLIHQKRIWRHV